MRTSLLPKPADTVQRNRPSAVTAPPVGKFPSATCVPDGVSWRPLISRPVVGLGVRDALEEHPASTAMRTSTMDSRRIVITPRSWLIPLIFLKMSPPALRDRLRRVTLKPTLPIVSYLATRVRSFTLWRVVTYSSVTFNESDISPYPPPNILILLCSAPISPFENRLPQTQDRQLAPRSQNNAPRRFLKMVDRQQLINLIHPLVVRSERQPGNGYAPVERRTVLQKRPSRPSGR